MPAPYLKGILAIILLTASAAAVSSLNADPLVLQQVGPDGVPEVVSRARRPLPLPWRLEEYMISFITDPPVVDRILRHLKWRPAEALLPNGRSPPAVLKVAESLPSAQSPAAPES